MTKRDHDEGLGGPYDPVSFGLSWGGLSVVLFLLDLPIPYLLRLQPWRPEQIWMWPLVPPLVIGGLSLLGLLCGGLGLRYSENKPMAKWGLLLNGIVVGLIALLWVVMRLIMTRR